MLRLGDRKKARKHWLVTLVTLVTLETAPLGRVVSRNGTPDSWCSRARGSDRSTAVVRGKPRQTMANRANIF